MDEAQKRQRGIILGVGGPIVVIFLLVQLDAASFGAILLVGIPLLILFLIIRALVRVGDKRPEPVQISTTPPPPPQPTSPPPGWYPDQQDPSLVRWFDGNVWTGAVLPRSQ